MEKNLPKNISFYHQKLTRHCKSTVTSVKKTLFDSEERVNVLSRVKWENRSAYSPFP